MVSVFKENKTGGSHNSGCENSLNLFTWPFSFHTLTLPPKGSRPPKGLPPSYLS